jgi:hypothetical protein
MATPANSEIRGETSRTFIDMGGSLCVVQSHSVLTAVPWKQHGARDGAQVFAAAHIPVD